MMTGDDGEYTDPRSYRFWCSSFLTKAIEGARGLNLGRVRNGASQTLPKDGWLNVNKHFACV